MKQWAVIVIMGAVLISVGSVQALTIYAAKDTFLNQDEYSENYGADDSLCVRKDVDTSEDDDKTTILAFSMSSIPENAVITSAKLSLYYYDEWYMPNSDHYLTVGIFPLLTNWTEGNGDSGINRSGASWKYKYAYGESNETWDADGARGSNDRGVLDVEIDIRGEEHGWKEWLGQNVTDTVAAWYAGTLVNYGWVMDYTGSNDDENELIFWSRTGGGTYGPKLEVNYYIIPEPATVVLLALGGLALLRKKYSA